MAGAISLSANNDTSEHIEQLWREVGRFESAPSMSSLNYPPHLTFAIYQQIEVLLLQDAVDHVFRDVTPLSLTFDGTRSFDASPQSQSDLLQLHAAIHKRINPIGCHEHYQPDSWVPHCTLGAQITDSRRDEALEFAGKRIEPFNVVFDRVDCISFPPLQVVSSLKLG
ncbi:MAG: 2'-5' RNA ligase family protein [Hyphomicrobiaceae bacterium]